MPKRSRQNSFLARKSRASTKNYSREKESLAKAFNPAAPKALPRNCKKSHIFIGGKPAETRLVLKPKYRTLPPPSLWDPIRDLTRVAVSADLKYRESILNVSRHCAKCGIKEPVQPYTYLFS